MRHVGLLCFFVVALGSSAGFAVCGGGSPQVEAGYREMYNLDFEGAHQTFQALEHATPDNPLPHVSNAAAYLFAEFSRMHILEIELFADNSAFEKRAKPTADPEVKARFEQELGETERIASENLVRSPNNSEAIFSQILANGLRGDYAAMIEKKNIAALGYMKSSRGKAEALIQRDSSCYDAYLAVGVENYLLGINPAPVRWMLRLTGSQTDKADGIAKLHLTAEKGYYLAPFARLLLAVAAVRDKDLSTARSLLSGLANDFPQNSLYKAQLARIR